MVVLERGERGEESKGEVRWRKGKRGAKVEEEVGHDKSCCIENDKDHVAWRTTKSDKDRITSKERCMSS